MLESDLHNTPKVREVMALSEQEVLSILLSGYSEDCIYADEYKKLIKKIGYGAYYEVRAFCQSQGAKDIRQWLINKNLYKQILNVY